MLRPFKPGGAVPPGLVLFIISFSFILVYSTSPTVYAGDSSLFTSASYFMGSAHHPAYPLLVLLGKLVTFIPLGSIALRANLLSALFGALTVSLVYEASLYLTKNGVISLLAPLATLSAPMFILESSKIEAYTLNAFIITLVFYLGLRAVREHHCFKEILVSFFILGLGMGNHHTTGFMLPLLLVVVVLRRRDLPRTTLPLGGILLAAGFSVYLYLYFRSTAGTSLDYSKVSSFSDFLIVFFRFGYDGNTVHALKGVSSNGGAWLYAGKNMGLLLFGEISVIALMLATLGIAKSFRERRVFVYLIVSVIIWLPLAKMTLSARTLTQEQMSISGPYFLQIIPIISTAAALGMHACYEFIIIRSAFVARGAAAALLVFQLVLVPEAAAKSSLSDYSIAYTWIKDISKIMGPKSFFLASGDNPIFISFYGFRVERLRDDILTLNRIPGSEAYGLLVSPSRKYSAWYPDFYESSMSSIEYFFPIAEKGRLYASSKEAVNEEIKKHVTPVNYVVTTIVLPTDSAYPLVDRFKKQFRKIDYLPISLGHRKDIMTSEINDNYARTVWHYANILGAEKNEEAEFYFKLAYLLSNGRLKYSTIKDYIAFVAWEKGGKAAGDLIAALKETAEEDRARNVVENIERWFETSNMNATGADSAEKDFLKNFEH